MKNVFAYTRVSTVRQGTQGSSLAEQKAAIGRYAEANQLRIIQWFEEQETAAKQGRPVFATLFKLLARGKATGVIIHKIDRSARNLRDWADLGELVDRGIDIHLAHESLDMTSRGGRLAADIQAVVAADYVRNLRQEVRKGIQGRLKQGLLPAPAPPGYLDQGGGKPKIPDPIKAPLIRSLFEMYASGRYSFHDLVQEARVIGLTGCNGRPLSKNGLTHLFHNEFYIGIIHHKVSGDRYPGVHEPIIPTALFREVQRALAERRPRKVAVNDLAYRRLVRCAGCGYYLVGERQKGRVYYRCHTRPCPATSVKEDILDACFLKALTGVTLPPEALPVIEAEFHTLMTERFGNREAAQSETPERARRLASKVEAFVSQFENPFGNRLIPLSNAYYDEGSHEAALFLRETHRAGMILSTAELASIVHIPDASVRQLALVREGGRTKAPPPCSDRSSLRLGMNTHRGQVSEVRVATTDRLAHCHVVGASGTGKSTFLLGTILADIEAGHGAVVLDPHGDLIDDLMMRIPDARIGDVIFFDPSASDCAVGLNILAAETEAERDHLAADVVSTFQKLATSWGDSMGSVLANAVLAIVESKRGGTLVDLRRFLLDPDTRKHYLEEIDDEEIRFFWEKSFPIIGTRSIGPILTRLDNFLRSKTMRRVVDVPKTSIAWGDVLSGGRILLCKFSLGLLGEENGSLLGSLMVSQLHQAALRRQSVAKAERSPAFVYVDEFQYFVTPSMAALLSEGRKYGIGLVLAHQTLSQIAGNAVESAVMGNAYTLMVFRVSEGDAAKLAGGFSFFEARDLLALGRGQAIVRLGSAERDCNVATAPPAQTVRNLVLKIEPPKPESPPEGDDPSEQFEDDELDTKIEASASNPVAEPREANEFLPVIVPKSRFWGQKHKSLAQLVARLGQERGFKAIHEEPVAGGRVDVALRRDDVSVACEISVSTEVTHELGNARKCLAASFSHVVLISSDEGKRMRLRNALADEGLADILVQSPDELAVFLDSLGEPAPTEKVVRGYKVRVKRQPQSPEEAAKRRDVIEKVISRPKQTKE